MAPKPDLAEIQKVKDLAAQGLSNREITERVKFGRTKVYLILNSGKQKAQNEHNKELRRANKRRYAKNQRVYATTNPEWNAYIRWRHELMREHSKQWRPEDKRKAEEIIAMRFRLEEEWGCKCHVDHVVSLKNGGRHHPSNMQILTAEDNMGKGAGCGNF